MKNFLEQTKLKKKVLPRFELGLLDSESNVLTITPQNLLVIIITILNKSSMENAPVLPTSFPRLPLNYWSSRKVDQCYHKLCEVGHGTYGCVYKAESLDEVKQIVALKQMQYMSSKHE